MILITTSDSCSTAGLLREAVYTTTPHTNRRFRNLDPTHDAQHPSIFFQSSANDSPCVVANGLSDTTASTTGIVYYSKFQGAIIHHIPEDFN